MSAPDALPQITQFSIQHLLSSMRGSIQAIASGQLEELQRLARVERELAQSHRLAADLHGDFAAINARLDRMQAQLQALIEREETRTAIAAAVGAV